MGQEEAAADPRMGGRLAGHETMDGKSAVWDAKGGAPKWRSQGRQRPGASRRVPFAADLDDPRRTALYFRVVTSDATESWLQQPRFARPPRETDHQKACKKMKSERRHELQHNALADWLGQTIDKLKPYSMAILGLVLLVLLGFGVYTWQSKVSAADSAKAWDDFHQAFNSGAPSDLDEVAKSHSGTDVAHWAAVVAADAYLNEGCEELFSNKANAGQELRKAVEHYKTVLKESRVSALRERATFGLARAYEALAGTRQSEGELDDARKMYEEVVQTWPKGPYTVMATRRLEDLNRQEIKEFYDDFATWKPKPAYAPPLPASDQEQMLDFDNLREGSVPDFSGTLGLDDPEEEEEEGEQTPPGATSPSPTEPGAAEATGETPSETGP